MTDTKTQPCHTQITPGSKDTNTLLTNVATVFDAIQNSVVSCEYPVGSPPHNPDGARVIYVAGTGTESELPQDSANGWSFDHPQGLTHVDPSRQRLRPIQGGRREPPARALGLR
ncbi:MAG TPA: hypothetical protein VNO21_12175 [Polyangiaceae bacterium]|nr:hypothetical protein [Polyangiaceae bacterium]